MAAAADAVEHDDISHTYTCFASGLSVEWVCLHIHMRSLSFSPLLWIDYSFEVKPGGCVCLSSRLLARLPGCPSHDTTTKVVRYSFMHHLFNTCSVIAW